MIVLINENLLFVSSVSSISILTEYCATDAGCEYDHVKLGVSVDIVTGVLMLSDGDDSVAFGGLDGIN